MMSLKKIYIKLINIFITKNFLLFILGGGLSYLIKIGLTWVMINWIELPYYVIYPISLLIAIIVIFFYNSIVTFRVTDQMGKRFIKYAISVLIFNLLDYGMVIFLTEVVSLYYLISIIIVTSILMICKFLVFKMIIFK